ncbi:hypothetical protein IU450_28035 [Nocardia abscessus]|uniref:hypothetical protein n=1 Tax=Nocardia abscessus TaxID=120957 RepID=UPI001895C483|nr:hypothetical protein [Nocardia abscessus]MBF6339712.1 hypothetical protein [Nocardia abscessus]
MTLEFTAFTADNNGFRFANGFVTPITVPGNIIKPPTLSGLCGGMSYAALDYFNAGKPIPTENFTATGGLPPTSTPLYRQILERHVASLGLNVVPPFTPLAVPLPGLPIPISVLPIPADTHNVLQFLKPNTFWTSAQLTQQIAATIAALRTGRPIPFGLVAATSILDSHVVVATGYDDAPPDAAVATDFFLYDCRHPMKTCTLRVIPQSQSCVLNCPGLPSEPWKAFFVEHYTAAAP